MYRIVSVWLSQSQKLVMKEAAEGELCHHTLPGQTCSLQASLNALKSASWHDTIWQACQFYIVLYSVMNFSMVCSFKRVHLTAKSQACASRSMPWQGLETHNTDQNVYIHSMVQKKSIQYR